MITAETTTNRERSSIPVTIFAARPLASGIPQIAASTSASTRDGLVFGRLDDRRAAQHLRHRPMPYFASPC